MPEHSLTSLNSQGNYYPAARYVLTAVLACQFLFMTEKSLGQSIAELNQLIFDPVLLDPVTQLEIHPENGALRNGITGNDNNNSDSLLEDMNALLSAGGISTRTRDLTFNIAQYEEQLARIEGDEGPFASNLYETLLDLGNQYQQKGDHESAIEIFERAEYVSRINHGLFHPEQVASIENLIESYLAIGDLRNANAKQRYLIYLSEQYFGENNLNALPSIISLADQNMENYERVLNMPAQPTFTFNTSGSSRQARPRQIAFGSLYQAQQNYVRAISTLMENRQYFDPVLLEVEYRYLETLFLQAYRSAIIDEPHYYLSERNGRTGSRIRSNNRRNTVVYLRGTYSFERLLIYTRSNPEADPALLVQTLMDYGDWNLLFGRTRTAVEKYSQANQVAQNRNIPEREIDNIFRPAIPVHLPLLTAKPNSRDKFAIAADETLSYDGHIDLDFTISRFGRAKKIKVLAKTENATKAIERRLMRFLRNSPFRPRLQKDDSVIPERVTLRYYFASAD